MLQDVLEHIHNWFEVDKYVGTFTVGSEGVTPALSLQSGQYFRVVGSVFNDGLHQAPYDDFVSETFTGEIWALAVPKAVQDLSEEIDEWKSQQSSGPYTSESFGGYSYTRPTGSDGAPIGWQLVFKGQLNRWRKLA